MHILQKTILVIGTMMIAGLLGALSAGAVGSPNDGGTDASVRENNVRPGTQRTGPPAALPDGPSWALRSFETTDDRLCLQAGELASDGRVGRYGAGRFFEEPVTFGGACGDKRPFLVVTRDLDSPKTQVREPSRTATYGALPAGARSATMLLPSGRQPLKVDGSGLFLHVSPTIVTGRFPKVEYVSVDGQTHQLGGTTDIDASAGFKGQ